MTPEKLAQGLFEIDRKKNSLHGWDYQAHETKESYVEAAKLLLDKYDIREKASAHSFASMVPVKPYLRESGE